MWHESETAATVTKEYHSGDGRLRIETLMPPSARGRVVVASGRDRWQYEPSRRVVYLSRSAALAEAEPVDRLLEQYAAGVARRPAAVAGRRAWRLELKPRLPDKAIRRMWVDADTGLVLRYERLRADGRMLGTSHFTDVRLGEPPAVLFERPGPPGTRVVRKQVAPKPISLAAAGARFGVTLPAALPAGYTFAGATLLAGKRQPVVHALYRDGLNAVSLYVGPQGGLPYDVRRGEAVALRHGTGRLRSARQLYMLSWRGPRADFALVGDASPELLALLANGTQLTGGAGHRRWTAAHWLLALAGLFLMLSGMLLVHRRRPRGRRALRPRLRPAPPVRSSD